MLKILLEKKNELGKVSNKYQSLLSKYTEKCKELRKLTDESNSICIQYDELQEKTLKLQEELANANIKYKNLDIIYNSYVNTSEVKYQSVNEQLVEVQTKLKQQEEHIMKLEANCKMRMFDKERNPKKCSKKCESSKEFLNNEIERLRVDNQKVDCSLKELNEMNCQYQQQKKDMQTEIKKLKNSLLNVSRNLLY